jgi:hypothetical protein
MHPRNERSDSPASRGERHNGDLRGLPQPAAINNASAVLRLRVQTATDQSRVSPAILQPVTSRLWAVFWCRLPRASACRATRPESAPVAPQCASRNPAVRPRRCGLLIGVIQPSHACVRVTPTACTMLAAAVLPGAAGPSRMVCAHGGRGAAAVNVGPGPGQAGQRGHSRGG